MEATRVIDIRENTEKIMRSVPDGVLVVAATKKRSAKEINEAIKSGITAVGENYVQEAETKFKELQQGVKRHFIGHLQRNKINKALDIFDTIETVDRLSLARAIDKSAGKKGIVFPVLVEVNSGREPQKSGVMPEDAEKLLQDIACLKNIKVEGLMTMGPLVDKAEDIRSFFRLTKELFDKLKDTKFPNIRMKYLSMGMSNTWRIAIEEGANIVRIGTAIFGPRR